MNVPESTIKPSYFNEGYTIGERLRHGALKRKRQIEPALNALKESKKIKPSEGSAKIKAVKKEIKDPQIQAIEKRSKIIETNTFSDIQHHIKPRCLILLDIDNTLIEPKQTLGSDQWFDWRIGYYKKIGLEPRHSLEAALMDWVSVQCLTDVQIVEPGAEKVVKYMQDEGFRVMGLTTRGASLATRTLQQLNKTDFDLTKSAPTAKEVVFLNPHEVIFKNGILFTAGTHKGKALFKYLELNKEEIPLESIEEVVFINDKRSPLEEIQETCDEHGIPFTGIRYGYLDDKVKNFSEDLALLQFENFAKILSDEEALRLLK